MAEKTQVEIDAEKQKQDLIREGIPESAFAKINTRAVEIAKKLRPKRPRETFQKWNAALVQVRGKVRDKLLNGALERARARGAQTEEVRQAGFDIPGQAGIPPVLGQPTGIPGQAVGIPAAPGAAPLPPALPGEGVPSPPLIQPPGPPLAPAVAQVPPIPLGQDPNLLTPEQNGPPLPTLGPQDLGPAPPSGVPTDPVTGLPPLPGLTDLPLPAAGGLPPLPPLPAESLEPAQVATPESMQLSRRMINGTQQENADIAEALDFISSGDPSFFDLDEGPVQELQEGPIGPPVG